MNRLRRFLILAVVLATVLFNGSGMTEQLEPDPISAGDIYQTEDSVILPMDALRVTEAVTPEDIRHTLDIIEKTKNGEMKQREPLSVVERGDGTYSIIDGNRSYSALKQLGAKNIPVIVVSRPYHKDELSVRRDGSGDEIQHFE